MSKNYNERLKKHKKRLFKKLFLGLIIPIGVFLLALLTLILTEEPSDWHTVNITVKEISRANEWHYKYSSKNYGVLVSEDGARYTTKLSVKGTEELFSIGEEYEIVYSKSYKINNKTVQAAKLGDEEIISLDASIKQFKINRTVLLVILPGCIVISAALTPIILRFSCKEELKCIKQIKRKQAKNT